MKKNNKKEILRKDGIKDINSLVKIPNKKPRTLLILFRDNDSYLYVIPKKLQKRFWQLADDFSNEDKKKFHAEFAQYKVSNSFDDIIVYDWAKAFAKDEVS